MKNLVKKMAGILAVLPVMALAVGSIAPTTSVFAADTKSNLTLEDGLHAAQGAGQPTELTGDTGIVTTVINILLFIVGIASVIMIIYSGIRYVTSGGNSNSVTAAKNTLIYAIVGLVVAIIAYALVNWVFTNVSPGQA